MLSTKTAQDNIDSRVAALRLEILALQALRNATLPIHRLPNELLVEVFLMVCSNYEVDLSRKDSEDHPRRIRCRGWVSLTRVCRHWWAVACSTPLLWRTIDVYDNVEWLSLCLSRAGDSTIQVSLHEEDTVLAAVPILLTVAHRLSTILLPCITQSQFQPIFFFLENKMPQLEELGVARLYHTSGGEAPPEDGRFDLSPTQFPSLKILDLTGVTIPWSSEAVSRLTSLVLDRCLRDANTPRIPLAVFLDVLESCSQLVVLTLHESLSQMLERNTPSQTHRAIVLPKLRSITLADHPRLDLAPFLSCLNLPIDVDITINPTFPYRDTTPVSFRSALPNNRHNIPILTSASQVRLINHAQREMTVHASPAQPSPGGITVDFARLPHHIPDLMTWNNYRGKALRDIVDLFSSSPLTSLELSGSYLYTEKREWDLLFTRFPTLERLTITLFGGPADAVRTIFSALLVMVRPGVGGSEDTVVCPGLQELSITTYYGLCTDETMVEIGATLRLRAKRGATALTKLHLQLPHPSKPVFEAREADAKALFAEVMPRGEARFLFVCLTDS